MEPITRSLGGTKSERYLASLCERTFLSLWSYPNLYTPEGRKFGKGAGKELCDLLVVFGSDILIFSDKDVAFNSDIDITVAWNRWRKRAITESARQLYGAEKWIRENPTQIYLDAQCTKPFPLQIDTSAPLRFHLIAVTKNSVPHAKKFYGGRSSGSLVLIPKLEEKHVAERPFTINDFNRNKTFVHVLDELTLNVLFEEIDTTYDLVRYLSVKEQAIRSGLLFSAPGEEDLLAYYMLNGGLIYDNPFQISPELVKQFEGITLIEGFWDEYLNSTQRAKMRAANEPSYFWDRLIENFAKHIRAGTVAIEKDKPVSTHEQAIRWMAAEGRLARRSLSDQFVEKFRTTPANRRSSRICMSPFDRNTCFILVLYPRDPGEVYESYRAERIDLLHSYALVAQYKFPHIKRITLIATEPQGSEGRAEDVLAVEGRPLTAEERKLAQLLMQEGNILADVSNYQSRDMMAPNKSKAFSQPLRSRTSKIGRNEPCPCGSGKKWKKCCIGN